MTIPSNSSSVVLGLACALSLVGCPSSPPLCTPGMSIACPCAGRDDGTQRCGADGTYGECACGDTDAGPRVDAGGSDAPAAGDAFVADAFTAPDIYAGLVPDAPSAWARLPTAEGQMGLEAGARACRVIGGDHPCDYEEVIVAHGLGQLDAIPMGTTAWLQRTTTVDVAGVPSLPGRGGNCADWTFEGNQAADGEYITFDAAGVPTYHFDADTAYDGIDTTHITPGDLDCGGLTRAILCCHAS